MTEADAIIREIEEQRNFFATRCAKYAAEIARLNDALATARAPAPVIEPEPEIGSGE